MTVRGVVLLLWEAGEVLSLFSFESIVSLCLLFELCLFLMDGLDMVCSLTCWRCPASDLLLLDFVEAVLIIDPFDIWISKYVDMNAKERNNHLSLQETTNPS